MCYGFNWQLACQFSSANNLSYRIVHDDVVCIVVRWMTYADCKQTPQGINYTGKISKTVNGTTCQKWTDVIGKMGAQTAQKFTDDKFADGSIKGAVNYCRNPLDPSNPTATGHHSTPWCFYSSITQGSGSSGLHAQCDVPLCSEYYSAVTAHHKLWLLS